jgi:hypothetical protein
MQFTKHSTVNTIAKQGSFMPSYWSAIDCIINRETGSGSVEDRVA